MSNQLPTDANADPIIVAMRRVLDLHPVTPFDFGNEVEHANRLRERADGSFYTRGLNADDVDQMATDGDRLRDERLDRD